MDAIQDLLKGRPVKAIVYADDILLICGGIDPDMIVSQMQKALNDITGWGSDNGLHFNPDKTQCCHILPGQPKIMWPRLRLGQKTMEYQDHFTYLGVRVESNLKWHNHIKEKCDKAKRLLNMRKAVVGQEWGLDPAKVLWIHEAIIRPKITYGSIIWAHDITVISQARLNSVQRQSLLSATHAMRSTPTAGMEAIMGVKPLHIFTRNCTNISLQVKKPV